MPIMNGEELQQIISEIYPSLPVIAHTGHDDYCEIANRFLSKGFAGYIAKPFEIKNMVSLIGNVLANRANQQAI